jgi:predicted N-formylglutamate amidohydrolase
MPDEADWPSPVEAVNEGGGANLVLLCEHASNHLPSEYRDLSLPAVELQRHIAWDIGAADVTRRLSALLDAPAFLGTYSRLFIDLNRPLDAPDSIPAHSESTEIPGNVHIAAAEAARRADTVFTPFHRRVADHLDRLADRERPTRLVSIHSYTPVFFGVARPWHAGVLFDRATDFGESVLQRLAEPGLVLGANVPYRTDRVGDYAIPVHGDDRGIPAIMIEIRNDLIHHTGGVEEWAARLATVLRGSF